MGKKLNVKIVDKTKIELAENGNVGDYVDLNELNQVDESYLNKVVEDAKKKEYEKLLNQKVEELNKLNDSRMKEEQAKLEKEKSDEVNKLNNQIESLKRDLKEKDTEKLNAVKDESQKNVEEVNKLNSQIESLKRDLKDKDTEKETAIKDAKQEKSDEINSLNSQIESLKHDLETNKTNNQLAIQELNSQHASIIKMKDEEIERYKDFRLGDSTKDLGESLEQYCHDAFDEIRSYAYPYAYFEKDNEIVKGGKGDFIFRDYDSNGINKTEIVSIMFEMKNQKDDTEKKHKNEDFFKKLNDDRNNKGIEYAVLVTTLEEDSKLYNNGIVDVSYKYPKMFVIRPQFFIAIIGLIRNLALNALSYKRQVAKYERENVDVVGFENAVKAVTDKLNSDYKFASQVYDNVDKMCDDLIKKIEAFRDGFRVAKGHINTAVNRIDDLSIRKLTKNNETMKEKFKEIEDKK